MSLNKKKEAQPSEEAILLELDMLQA